MSTTLHMSLSVRGALRWPNRMLRGLFRNTQTGAKCTADEAREVLMDKLSEGIEMLPMGKCEGHDPKRGCPGHEDADEVTP